LETARKAGRNSAGAACAPEPVAEQEALAAAPATAFARLQKEWMKEHINKPRSKTAIAGFSAMRKSQRHRAA
jgi:hypothetical protein